MNIIIDIGNSSAKAAVFDGDDMLFRKHLDTNLVDSIAKITTEYPIDAGAFSSVGTTPTDFEQNLRKIVPHCLHIKGTTPTPLICDYKSALTLGADRLASAVGASRCCPHKPLLIIDAGTCITYDYVSPDSHYLGGNISPGIGMRLRALHNQTACLPLVEAEGICPETGIGNDTETAIRLGVIAGIEHEINGYIRNFRQKNPNAHVFLTGGNGYRFGREPEIEHNNALVEIGLNCILQYNKKT